MMRVLFIQNIAEIENINVEKILFTAKPKPSRSHITHIYLMSQYFVRFVLLWPREKPKAFSHLTEIIHFKLEYNSNIDNTRIQNSNLVLQQFWKP